MKNQIAAYFALAAAIGAIALHFAQKPPKMGYAETAVLMAEFSESIKARRSYEEAKKEWDANLKALNDSLLATMDRMKADYDKSPAATKDSLRNLLQKRNDDLQRYTEAVKRMAMTKEKELMDPVVRKINSHLDLWGKQNGYDMIFGTLSGGVILQANSGFNVTARVLKDLNDQYRELPAGDPPEAAKADAAPAGDSAKEKPAEPASKP